MIFVIIASVVAPLAVLAVLLPLLRNARTLITIALTTTIGIAIWNTLLNVTNATSLNVDSPFIGLSGSGRRKRCFGFSCNGAGAAIRDEEGRAGWQGTGRFSGGWAREGGSRPGRLMRCNHPDFATLIVEMHFSAIFPDACIG